MIEESISPLRCARTQRAAAIDSVVIAIGIMAIGNIDVYWIIQNLSLWSDDGLVNWLYANLWLLIASISLAAGVLLVRRQTLGSLGLHGLRPGALAVGIGGGLGGLAAGLAITAATLLVLDWDKFHDWRAEYAPIEAFVRSGNKQMIVIVFVIAAISEEVLFRALLLHRLQDAFGRDAPAIALSSTHFALGHSEQGLMGVVLAFVMSLILSGVYCRTKSLPAAVMGHFLINCRVFMVPWLFP